MADLNIRFEIRVSQRVFCAALAAFMLAIAPTELSSESVSLSTYYPAPSGVYTKMLTTDQTWLARDGGPVAIGTANPAPGAKLDINANGAQTVLEANSGAGPSPRFGLVDTSLGAVTSAPAWYIDNNADEFRVFRQPNIGAAGTAYFYVANTGNVGVGAAAPGAKLDVSGSGGANVDFRVNGRIQTGYAGPGSGGMWVDGGNQFFGSIDATHLGLWHGGWWFQVDSVGNSYVSGMLVAEQGTCVNYTTAYTVGGAGGTNTPVCSGASQFATLMDGFMPDTAVLGPEGANVLGGGGGQANDPNVTFRCCPCPASGCPSLP